MTLLEVFFENKDTQYMDDFIKRAFERAINDIPDMHCIEDEFAALTPRLFSVFISHAGEENAARFIKEFCDSCELVMLLFIYFTAGVVKGKDL